jgi:hypothetical protein
MPNEKSTTPPVTPLASIAGKIKDAVAAQNGGADATVTSYVKKLGETVTPEKAAEILAATEAKVAATRK